MRTRTLGVLALVLALLSGVQLTRAVWAQMAFVPFNAPVIVDTVIVGSLDAQALAGEARIFNAGVGSSTAATPSYIGGGMFNFLSDRNLSATKNILFGVLGKYEHTGTSSSTYPGAAVVGEVADNTSAAYAAVMAVMGGDSAAEETAVAAFGVDWQTSAILSRFNFGLDLQGNGTHDSYVAPRYNQAALRLGGRWQDSNNATVFTANNICLVVVNSAPVDGVAGTRAGTCGPGSLLIRADNGTLFQNTNTLASPTWTAR